MKKIFEVSNVKCGGCANTIIKKLTEANFKEVTVNLSCEPRKVTTVIENEVHEAQFRDLLVKLGYPLLDEDYSALKSVSLKAKSFVSCAIGKIEINRNQM